MEGFVVGVIFGVFVGSTDGLLVGSIVGSSDGSIVGSRVGSNEEDDGSNDVSVVGTESSARFIN